MRVLTSMSQVDLTIGRGTRHSWAKEPEDAWTARILGLDTKGMYSIRAVEVTQNSASATVAVHFINDDEQKLFEVIIARTRAYALLTWARAKVFDLKVQPDTCVNIIVMAHDGSAFLLQRKDDKHPNPMCRQRLCPFGGGVVEYESGYEAALRELYEEIRRMDVVDEMAARMVMQEPMKLAGVQWAGYYLSHWAVVRADDAEQFERWRYAICDSPGLAESDPVCLKRDDFRALCIAEDELHGTHFVSATDVLMSRALQLVRADRLHEEVEGLKETFDPTRVEIPGQRPEGTKCHHKK